MYVVWQMFEDLLKKLCSAQLNNLVLVNTEVQSLDEARSPLRKPLMLFAIEI